MTQYLDLLQLVLDRGKFKSDRTGTGTYSVFGAQARFPLQKNFPLLTTKKLHLRSIIYELLWFLRGERIIRYLRENKVTIGDEWADKNGDLGPVYGKQWRNWVKNSRPRKAPDSSSSQPTLFDLGESGEEATVIPAGPRVRSKHGIDQIDQVIEQIEKNPDSRRLIVSAWNFFPLKDYWKAPLLRFCTNLVKFYVFSNQYRLPVRTTNSGSHLNSSRPPNQNETIPRSAEKHT